MLIFIQLLLITGAATQVPNSNKTNVALGPPQIRQCFYEGIWYSAGTVINSGRSSDWCFGTYCDFDGMIKNWDDFSCVGSLAPQRWHRDSPPIVTPAPTTTPSPTVFQSMTNFFGSMGCWYRGRFFWSGQDIENFRRGRRCLGKYCDWNGQIQSWSDDCRYTMPPIPTPVVDYT